MGADLLYADACIGSLRRHAGAPGGDLLGTAKRTRLWATSCLKKKQARDTEPKSAVAAHESGGDDRGHDTGGDHRMVARQERLDPQTDAITEALSHIVALASKSFSAGMLRNPGRMRDAEARRDLARHCVAKAMGGATSDKAVIAVAASLPLGLPRMASKEHASGFDRLAAALAQAIGGCPDNDEMSCERIATLINGAPADHVVRNLLSRIKALRRLT